MNLHQIFYRFKKKLMLNSKIKNYRWGSINNCIHFILSLIVSSMVLASVSAYSEIYRWKDENGKTHFSDKVVESVEQKNIKLKINKSKWKRYIVEVDDVDSILTDTERLRIEIDVNAVYQFYDEKLYFDFYKTVPVKIRLYEKQENYQSYLSDRGYKNNKGTRGVYLPKSNEIVLYLNKKDRWRTFWTIKHEASHAIVDSLTAHTPAWFNEGLAENMESLGLREDIFFLYPHTENKRSINRAKKSGNRLRVDDFLSLNSRDYYASMKNGDSRYQAYSGELVRMLLTDERGKNIIRRMLHIYKSGSRSYSSHIIEEHYFGGLTALQIHWDAWVIRDSSKKILL